MRGMLGTIGFIGVIAWSAPVLGLTSISAYKTFTRELLTSSDLNSSFTRVINGVNNLNAKFPGDSVKVGTAAMDSAVANPGPSITFKSPLASVAAEDSLIFHRANLKRVHTDSLFVGPVPVTAPSWAIGVTAGRQSHFSYADIDSVVINSTFSIGTTAVTATATELNLIDGVTATTAELNILDGVTATAIEINLIDGYTGTTANLNTLTDASVADGLHSHTTSAVGVTYDQTIAKLDTTIGSVGTSGGGGYKVIVGSLLNWDDNCVGGNRWQGRWDCSGSYEAWREKEKSTSWYQAARGDTSAQFPTNYAIRIQVGQDSVTVWNRDTGELWMAFAMASSGQHMIGNTGDTVNDVAMKDGTLYLATGGGNSSWGFAHRINFLSDISEANYISGLRRWPFNIQNRNASGGTEVDMSSVAIVSNTVNAVAVVRDPFGLTDENGAPKHWWIVAHGTNSNTGLYNPHQDAIYDGTATSADIYNVSYNRRGRGIIATNDSGADDFYEPWENLFTISADGMTNTTLSFNPNATGALSLGWPSTPISGRALQTNQLSILGENSDKAFVYSTSGVYALHLNGKRSGGTSQAKQRLSSTVNAPVEFGNAVLTLALEDNTTDSSPYGNTMTSTGGGGTVSAVFGNGYSAVAGSYLNRIGDAEFNIGTTDFGVHFWFKMAANPPASAILTTVRDVSEGDLLHVSMATDGTIDAFISDDGGSTSDQVSPSADVADNQWHHFAFVRDSEVVTVYYDGVNVGTDAVDAVTTGMLTDDITIGANVDPGSNGGYADGLQLDDWQLSPTNAIGAEAIAKIHAEGRKQLNRGGSPINRDHLHAADVDYVDALDNGIWLAGNEDSLTVFDGRLALQTFGASGTINDAKLIQNAGTDSIGVIIVTNTETILIQPDVNLEKMASSTLYHKEPILIGETVVVDSAGTGHFWTISDATAAGHNAGHPNIFVQHGTYGPAIVSQRGINIKCAGARSSVAAGGMNGTVINGNATAIAMSVTGYDVDISNCGFYTAPSGAGGGYRTVDIAGTYVKFHENIIINSDESGIYVQGAWNTIQGNNVIAADAAGIYITSIGDLSTVVGNTVTAAGNDIQLDAGGNYATVVGNVIDEAVVDNAAGSAVSANAIY